MQFKVFRSTAFALFAFWVALGPGVGSNAVAQPIATGYDYAGFDLGITGTTFLGQQNFLWSTLGTGSNAGLRTYLPFGNLGSGLGIVGGAKVGFSVFDKIDIETKLRFMTNHTSREESFDNLILDPYYLSARGAGTSSYSLTQSSLSLAVLAHYRLTNFLYAIGGLDVALYTGNSFTSQQSLNGQSPYYIRPTTHTVAFVDTLGVPKTELLNTFSNYRADAQLGIGSVFRIGENNMLLDAELLVSIPFTSWMAPAGRAHLDSTVAYLNQNTPSVQPAITYPNMWYVSLTVGLRFPLIGSFPPPDHTNDPQSDPISITAVTSRDAVGNVVLTGRVTNAKTGKPIVANLTTVDLKNNNVVSTNTTDSNGYYSIPVTGPGEFSVTANADGYLFGTALFEVDSQGRILKSHANISLTEAANGRTRLLVFFEVNKAELQPSSTPELNRAVDLMKAVPTMEVEIAGYTDATGTADYNKALAGRRANAVREFLIQHGIPQDRVEAHGYGEDSPISSNDTDEGRSENRRVEFVVRKW